jgi:hypothetical protein
MSFDAVFVGERGVLIARNAEAGRNSAPFLLVDTVSGETLPLVYPATTAFTLYKNGRDVVYGAVIKSGEGPVKTEVIRLEARNPEDSSVVCAYDGEDDDFSFIEYGGGSGGLFASTAGGEDVSVILEGGVTKTAERAPAFPRKLLPLSGNFAAVDGDGSIIWYDGASGEIAAMLRFYETGWLLSKRGGETKRGGFTESIDAASR